MEFLIISTLVTADILMGVLYRYWDSMKPTPLTFLEFFNFMYDHREDVIKILEEQNEEIRKNLINNYLNTRDLINKKKMIAKIKQIVLRYYPAFHRTTLLLSSVYLVVLAVGGNLSSVPFFAGLLAASFRFG